MWVVNIGIHLGLAVLCGLMYRLGGDGKVPFLWIKGANAKLWRTVGIGGLVGVTYFTMTHNWLSLACFGTYFIPDIFPYGDKPRVKFWGDYGQFLVNGLCFGLASFPAVGLWCIPQILVAGLAWMGIKWLDDKNWIKNPWVERLRGFVGTVII